MASDRGPAPIIVFAYKRPGHLRRTLEALRANAEARDSAMVIACDGPRSPADQEACAEVQALARATTGFASVEVRVAPRNRGLAAAVIAGVTQMLERDDRVIVVEDDLLVSSHFLRYLNDGLACYAGDERVASIHAYTYPTRRALPETFFLRGADCWGWATWRRAWQGFEPDGRALLEALAARGLTRAFDLDGTYPFSNMLAEQVAGHNDSWAVRWHASCFLADRLTLYPGRSLVHNIGTDASGTHGSDTAAFAQVLAAEPVRVERIPLAPSESAREAFKDFFRRSRPSLAERLQRRLARLRTGGG